MRPKKKSGQKLSNEPEDKPKEEITADKVIGNIEYHFTVYRSANEPDICLITNGEGAVAVMRKDGRKWRFLPPANRSVFKKEKELATHTEELARQTDISDI